MSEATPNLREARRMLGVPCRVFGQAARREALPFRRRPLGIGCSFRVLSSANYRGIGFREPRYAVGHSLGYAGFVRRAAPVRVSQPVHPLFEFRLPPESCPA
jgi:hypothetical protein